MSTDEQWDFIVPEDDGELLVELRRYGVRPGQRLDVSVKPVDTGEIDETAGKADRRPRRLSFAGAIHAEPDLSERVDDCLKGLGKA